MGWLEGWDRRNQRIAETHNEVAKHPPPESQWQRWYGQQALLQGLFLALMIFACAIVGLGWLIVQGFR